MSTESFVAKDLPDENREESGEPNENRDQDAAEGNEEEGLSNPEISDAVEQKEQEDSPDCDAGVGEPETEEADETCPGEVDISTEAVYGDSLEPPEGEEPELPSESDAPKDEEEKLPEKLEGVEISPGGTTPMSPIEDVASIAAKEEGISETICSLDIDAPDEKETTGEIREDGDEEGLEDIKEPVEASKKE